MIVNLIALVFVAVAGVIDTEPTAKFTYDIDFDTVVECEAAKDTDDVKEAVADLLLVMRNRYPKDVVSIKLECVQ